MKKKNKQQQQPNHIKANDFSKYSTLLKEPYLCCYFFFFANIKS